MRTFRQDKTVSLTPQDIYFCQSSPSHVLQLATVSCVYQSGRNCTKDVYATDTWIIDPTCRVATDCHYVRHVSRRARLAIASYLLYVSRMYTATHVLSSSASFNSGTRNSLPYLTKTSVHRAVSSCVKVRQRIVRGPNAEAPRIGISFPPLPQS